MGIAIPPRLKIKQTLKRLCYEYNGFQGLNYESIGNTSILGLDIPTDDIYKLMLFSVCDEYWYAEIGFDIDEQFIERFQDTWYRYSSTYHTVIANLLNNDIFNKSRVITSNELNTGETENNKKGTQTSTNTGTSSSAKTGTDTLTKTGTIGTESSSTDYAVQTQTSASTETRNLTDEQTFNTKVENEQNLSNEVTNEVQDNFMQNLQRERTITEEYKDFTVDKLREYLKNVDILNEFVHCFDKLFMQILMR